MSIVSKPTEGPWKLTYSNCWITGRDPERGEIVVAKMETGTLSDALQIRAAPEMLSALRGAEKALLKALPHLPPDKEAVYCGEWLAEIREAIAKATEIPDLAALTKPV